MLFAFLLAPAAALLLSSGAPPGSIPVGTPMIRLAPVCMRGSEDTENFRERRNNLYEAIPPVQDSRGPAPQPVRRSGLPLSSRHEDGNPLSWATESQRVPAPFVGARLAKKQPTPPVIDGVPSPSRADVYDDMTVISTEGPAPIEDTTYGAANRANKRAPERQAPVEDITELAAAPKPALETRVDQARSVCAAAIDKRARELAQSAIDDYFADLIDEVELKQRKDAALQQASAEYDENAQLDKAQKAYKVAADKRDAAELALIKAQKALAKAAQDEDDAAYEFDQALRAVEQL